jgi:hypothetical protein
VKAEARLRTLAKRLPANRRRVPFFIRSALLRLPGFGRDLNRVGRFFSTSKRSHGYFDHYAFHLAARRRRPLTILEIGIGGGSDGSWTGESLRLWKTYFPRSMVYGIDVEVEEEVAERRIRVLRGDQSDVEFLSRVAREVGPIDLVIDDGSHVQRHIRTSFGVLFPQVVAGGFYVIEDLQTAYWPRYGGAPPGVDTHSTAIGLVKELIDGLHHRYFEPADDAPIETARGVSAVHAYEKIVFIEKAGGPNASRTANRRR